MSSSKPSNPNDPNELLAATPLAEKNAVEAGRSKPAQGTPAPSPSPDATQSAARQDQAGVDPHRPHTNPMEANQSSVPNTSENTTPDLPATMHVDRLANGKFQAFDGDVPIDLPRATREEAESLLAPSRTGPAVRQTVAQGTAPTTVVPATTAVPTTTTTATPTPVTTATPAPAKPPVK